MSVYRRKEDGKWRVQVSYKDLDGRNRRISKTCKTRREAIALEASIHAKMGNGTDPNVTVDQVCDHFLRIAERDVKKTTEVGYEKIFRLHIRPTFGGRAVARITTVEIDEWKRKEEAKGYKKAYLNILYKALRKVFAVARKEFGIQNDAVDRAGPFKEDPNRVKEPPPLNVWTLEDFQKWMRAIEDEEERNSRTSYTLEAVKVYIAIMMLAGLRKGEANALLVSDFHDGDFPYLSVNKSLTEKLKGIPYYITSPKTESSIRDVPVPDYLAQIIRSHVERIRRLPAFSEDSFFLCGGPRPVSDTNAEITKNRMERKAGIKHIRIHDLRHSYVSLLINARTDIALVSNLVGHATTSVTMKVYSHLYPKTKNKAVSRLNELLGKEEE